MFSTSLGNWSGRAMEQSTGCDSGGKKVAQLAFFLKISLFEALYLLPVDSNMTHFFCIRHMTPYTILLLFKLLQNQRCNGRYPGLKSPISGKRQHALLLAVTLVTSGTCVKWSIMMCSNLCQKQSARNMHDHVHFWQKPSKNGIF